VLLTCALEKVMWVFIGKGLCETER